MATLAVTNRPAATEFAAPAKRPAADILIFDGQCRLCRAQIERLERYFAAGRLAYLSLHDPEVGRRFPDLTHEALMREMYVVDSRGGRYAGVAAVRYLSRHLPRLWWLAPLLHVPGSMPLWRWLYRQVAEHRYLFGRVEACDDVSCAVHR